MTPQKAQGPLTGNDQGRSEFPDPLLRGFFVNVNYFQQVLSSVSHAALVLVEASLLLLLPALDLWLSSEAPFQGQKKDPFLRTRTLLPDCKHTASSHPDILPVCTPVLISCYYNNLLLFLLAHPRHGTFSTYCTLAAFTHLVPWTLSLPLPFLLFTLQTSFTFPASGTISNKL